MGIDWSKTKEISKENEYYLVNIHLDGTTDIRTETLKEIGQSEIGLTRPKIVEMGGKRGFRKDSSQYDESDDLECLLNAIGRKLGIPMAEEYRIYNQAKEKDSLLSLDVSENGCFTFREMNKIWEEAVSRFLEKQDNYQSWMGDWNRIIKRKAFPDIEGSNEFLCETDADCETAIMLPIYILAYLYNQNEAALECFRKNYFQMIVFDLLTGQTDRTMDNYGILTSVGKEDYRFAPLFDNANLVKPNLPKNIYTLNYVAIDRMRILRILMEKYSGYVKPLMERLVQELEPMLPQVFETVNSWITDENSDRIIANIKQYFAMYKTVVGKALYETI